MTRTYCCTFLGTMCWLILYTSQLLVQFIDCDVPNNTIYVCPSAVCIREVTFFSHVHKCKHFFFIFVKIPHSLGVLNGE